MHATAENELDHPEFLININKIKFAGGEGSIQFGSDVTHSSTHPQLKFRLWQLWRVGLLRKQLVEGEANVPDSRQKDCCFIIIIKFSSQVTWKGSWLKFQNGNQVIFHLKLQSDISPLKIKVREQSYSNSTDLTEHATAEKKHDKFHSQEYVCEVKPLVGSSRTIEQPLRGLFPEELGSSSRETSQLRGSSKESYSILQ